MRKDILNNLIESHRPKPKLNVWQFSEKYTDFRKVAYDTPLKAKYSADYMPIYKEICEATTDKTIRQIWVQKSARSGFTENVLLGLAKYKIGYSPSFLMWITSTQQLAEQFYKERFVPSLEMTTPCKEQLAKAQRTEHNIIFPNSTFTLGWAKGKAFGRAIGIETLILDELSTYDPKQIPVLIKRCDSYPFHLVIGGGSPAVELSPEADPIFGYFEQGDQRYWFSNDGISDFKWEMGNKKTKYGLKWDEDAQDKKTGEWDLKRVNETAHYVTPNGIKIYEKDRMDFVRKGQWIPTNSNNLPEIRSYHINSFLIPFLSFSQIAIAFLQHKKQDLMKNFWNEWMGEKHYFKSQKTDMSSLPSLELGYGRGELPSQKLESLKEKKSIKLMHTDVQGNSFWSLYCEIIDNNIYIFDHAHTYNYDDTDKFFEKYREVSKNPKTHSWSMDAGYSTSEVFHKAFITKKISPVFGRSNTAVGSLITTKLRDPYEGTKLQNAKNQRIRTFTVDPNYFKDIAYQLLNNSVDNKLYLYHEADFDLCKQLTSEQKKVVNGTVKWEKVKKDNHLWDCLYNIIAQGVYHRILNLKGVNYAEAVTNDTFDDSSKEGQKEEME